MSNRGFGQHASTIAERLYQDEIGHLERLFQMGLTSPDATHKQYVLQEIAKALAIDISWIEHSPGTKPA